MLLEELLVCLPKYKTLFCDNINAEYLLKNPMLHSRTKHLEIDFYFIRDKI